MWLPNVGLQKRNLYYWKQEKVTKSPDSEILLFHFFFWLSHVACRILVSHLGMESWHWKHEVRILDNRGLPRKSPLITDTSPTLLCDLCSCHSPFSPSTPTMPAFILFPEYVTLISTHRAFAVPSVMDSFAKYLCVAASFLSDQVSSSQKKKKKKSSLFHYLCHGLLLQSHFQTYTVVSSWKDLWLLKWPCVCVCSLVQCPTPKSGHSLRARPLYSSTQLTAEERNTQWMNTHHTHTHTQATAFQLGVLLFKEAEMEAKKTHHTSFVKSPCPAPAWLSVSSVFGYLGFLPVGRRNKQGKQLIWSPGTNFFK